MCVCTRAERHEQIYNIVVSATENSRVNVQIQTRIREESTQLLSHRQSDLTWLERSALIWLYFCPKVFPNVSGVERFERVAVSGGVAAATIQQWVCRSHSNTMKFTPLWYNVVEAMTWKDVRKYFAKRWVSKRAHLDDELNVKKQIKRWTQFRNQKKMQTLTKFMDVPHAKRASLSKKRPSQFFNLTGSTKRARRSDKGKTRVHPEVSSGVQKFVQDRWNSGDPCNRRHVVIYSFR